MSFDYRITRPELYDAETLGWDNPGERTASFYSGFSLRGAARSAAKEFPDGVFDIQIWRDEGNLDRFRDDRYYRVSRTGKLLGEYRVSPSAIADMLKTRNQRKASETLQRAFQEELARG